MADKTIVLISGGNTGIGFETVKALVGNSKVPYIILMGSRSLEKAETAIATLKEEFPHSESEVLPLQLDITSDESIQAAFDRVEKEYGRLDVLINNAGASHDSIAKQKPTLAGLRESIDTTYSVNVTSTHVITHVFAPLLIKSANPRLLFVTSGLSSLTNFPRGAAKDNKLSTPSIPAGWPKPPAPAMLGYRVSKTALNMLMRDWARVLENDGVKTWAISPGMLATGLGWGNPQFLRDMGAEEPAVGGEFIRSVVEGGRDGDVAKVVSRDGVQSW